MSNVSADREAALRERLRSKPLRIGISTRALFDLEEEHAVFVREGVEAYASLQRLREESPIAPGPAFRVVRRLLQMNEPDEAPYVEVVLLSQNSPDLSLRAFRSIEHYGLPIKNGSFTSGRSLAPFVSAWSLDLFLSNEQCDVEAAALAGIASARLGQTPLSAEILDDDEVRIAFDGDAVVFGAESDGIYKREGLDAFLRHETDNAAIALPPGPFSGFLSKLALLRRLCLRSDGSSRVRIAIVTARTAPAHARVVRTLRTWLTPADEAHFVGYWQKASILAAFKADIFFDDQEQHVLGASRFVPAALVGGPHDASCLVVPAHR